MTRTIQTLILLITVILMSSFVSKNTDSFIGTYSVSASDPDQIKLIINADHTFYYQDFSISEKKIVSRGNWTQKGNKVILEDKDAKFHHVWTFDKNAEVATSRKGFTFYRLCKMVK